MQAFRKILENKFDFQLRDVYYILNFLFKYLNVGVMYKIVSEYDQEIPQSQTADKPMALPGRATQQSRDTRKTN